MTALSISNPPKTHLQYSALILAIWFGSALILSLTGAFDATIVGLPMTLILGISTPLLLFVLAYQSNKAFHKFIQYLDVRPLILLHTWRMLGLGFVFLAFHEVVSPIFAFPAGFGDAATAVGALLLGVGLYKGTARLSHVYLWSMFGLLDFVVAVILGILALPNMGFFEGDINTAAMGYFPLALIPGFVVPFYVITHIVILLNARRQYGQNNKKNAKTKSASSHSQAF